jgi:hypothetical protein
MNEKWGFTGKRKCSILFAVFVHRGTLPFQTENQGLYETMSRDGGASSAAGLVALVLAIDAARYALRNRFYDGSKATNKENKDAVAVERIIQRRRSM